MVTVCICLFKAIGKLQRERLHQSHAVAFSWNAWIFPSLLLCHRPHRVWSVVGIFHMEEVGMSRGGAQTVCTRLFFSAYAREPGNEATMSGEPFARCSISSSLSVSGAL